MCVGCFVDVAGSRLDSDVELLSKEIIDKRPGVGQAWVVSGGGGGSNAGPPGAKTARTMRLALNNKADRHSLFLLFLRLCGVWPLLSSHAKRALAEHGEKLAVAIALFSIERTCGVGVVLLSGCVIVIV